MSHESYAVLISDFLSTAGIDQSPPIPEEPGPLDFKIGGYTCTVFPLEEEEKVVIQSEVMPLDSLDPDQATSAMKLLHRLNWGARCVNGIMAMIDADGTVVVSKTLETALIDGDCLGETMAEVLEAAENLTSILKAGPSSAPEGEQSDWINLSRIV
jgi:hypothetical protein